MFLFRVFKAAGFSSSAASSRRKRARARYEQWRGSAVRPTSSDALPSVGTRGVSYCLASGCGFVRQRGNEKTTLQESSRLISKLMTPANPRLHDDRSQKGNTLKPDAPVQRVTGCQTNTQGRVHAASRANVPSYPRVSVLWGTSSPT